MIVISDKIFEHTFIYEEIMVEKYLEDIRNILLNQKKSLEHKINELNHMIEEDKQFIRILDEKTDANFESLTPRVINNKNKEKIAELQNSMKESNLSCETMQQELKEIESKLEECEKVLSFEKEQKIKINEMNQTIEEHDLSVFSEALDKVDRQLKFCESIAAVDPQRCKLELQQIKQLISKMRETASEIQEKNPDTDSEENISHEKKG